MILLVVSLCCSGAGSSFFLPSALGAVRKTELKCAICGRNVTPGSKYLQTPDGRIFCSDKCFQATLPVCAGCGKRTAEGVVITGMNERLFCNRCAAKPKCFCCSMPADCGTLADGRFICPECTKTAVLDEKCMIGVVTEVRAVMKDKLHISTDHQIKFTLADINTLSGKTKPEHDATELGTYLYEELTEKSVLTTKDHKGVVVSRNESAKVTKTHAIYILYGIARDKMIEVAAHELAHDWLQENYPGISNLQVQEGWAEFAASLVNSTYGRDFMNNRMQKNSSVIYGGGYRLVAGAANKGSAALTKLFDRYNAGSSGAVSR